jgi:predicted small secreted protein
MIKKAALLLVLLVLTTVSLGCNTIRGVGRDISAVGDALSDAAGGKP